MSKKWLFEQFFKYTQIHLPFHRKKYELFNSYHYTIVFFRYEAFFIFFRKIITIPIPPFQAISHTSKSAYFPHNFRSLITPTSPSVTPLPLTTAWTQSTNSLPVGPNREDEQKALALTWQMTWIDKTGTMGRHVTHHPLPKR